MSRFILMEFSRLVCFQRCSGAEGSPDVIFASWACFSWLFQLTTSDFPALSGCFRDKVKRFMAEEIFIIKRNQTIFVFKNSNDFFNHSLTDFFTLFISILRAGELYSCYSCQYSFYFKLSASMTAFSDTT
jgi:hypothetical protein